MKFPGWTMTAGLLLVISLAGQQNPTTAMPLFNLNVAAFDSRGQPVPDLRAEDFQILDNGKPRKVVWLRPVHRNSAPATFILLDLFNADLAARGLSANEIVHTLEKLESADNVYLYLLTSTAKIFAIHSVVPSGVPSGAEPETNDGPWTRRIKPMLDDALKQVNALRSGNDQYPQLRIGPTWQALSGLASQFAEVPGPKSFVWITQGVLNGFEEPGRLIHVDTAPLREFADTLNVLETAVYSVQQRPGGSLAPEGEGSAFDTLTQLSALTGGKAFATDATAQAITQARSDAQRVNYRVVFSPDRLDGKDHKIRVTTSGTMARKDIKIQTAQNYYAIAAPDIEARDAAFVEAIGRGPFDYPEIGVAAKLARVDGTQGQFRFAIHVNAPDVLFLNDGTRHHAGLAVGLVEYGPYGIRTIADSAPVNLDMSEEDYAKAMTGGIEITREAGLDETTSQVRLVVLDRNSSLAGAVTVPVNQHP
jgi:VWFA-related protein